MITTWFILAAAFISLAVFLWLVAALKFHSDQMREVEQHLARWRDLERPSPFTAHGRDREKIRAVIAAHVQQRAAGILPAVPAQRAAGILPAVPVPTNFARRFPGVEGAPADPPATSGPPSRPIARTASTPILRPAGENSFPVQRSTFSLILLLFLLSGSGCSMLHVRQTDTTPDERIITTDLRASTWFSSAQLIEKLRATTTDKTQTFGADSVAQHGNTNSVAALQAIVQILQLLRPTP